jgi:hypothetical protein
MPQALIDPGQIDGLLRHLPLASGAELDAIEAALGAHGVALDYLACPGRLMADAGLRPDPWQADLLNSYDRQVLLLCSRQAGKSQVASALALRAALTEPGSLVLLLSPTLRQSGELFRDKVMRLYKALPAAPPPSQESALTLTLPNGSRVISLPGDEGTIRGYSGVALLVIDEAAMVPDDLYRAVRPMLAVSGGGLVALSTPRGKQGWFHAEWHGPGPWKRVRVPATDCPRISAGFLAEERRAMGETYYRQEYLCSFEDSAGEPLFPGDWLDHAERLAALLEGRPRRAEGVGIDTGEGVADTSFAAVDRLGLIELVSVKTPDTSQIPGLALAFIRRHGVRADCVCVDRGGGGLQLADHLNNLHFSIYSIRTVPFGGAVAGDPVGGRLSVGRRTDQREERYAYKKMRDRMYGRLRELLDPSGPQGGWAVPARYAELRRQLAPIPLLYDGEGRLELPPKNRRESTPGGRKSLVELIGRSPDDADAVVLACEAMCNKPLRVKAGGMG